MSIAIAEAQSKIASALEHIALNGITINVNLTTDSAFDSVIESIATELGGIGKALANIQDRGLTLVPTFPDDA